MAKSKKTSAKNNKIDKSHEQNKPVVSKTTKRLKSNLSNNSQEDTVSHVQLKIKDKCLQINGKNKSCKAIPKKNHLQFNLKLSAKPNKAAVGCSNLNDIPVQQIQRAQNNERRSPRLQQQSHLENLKLLVKSNGIVVERNNSNDIPIQQIRRVQNNERRVSPRLHQQFHLENQPNRNVVQHIHGNLDNLCVQPRDEQCEEEKTIARFHQQAQIIKQSKTSSKLIAPTLQSIIDSSWKNCKIERQNIKKNTIVMAKMRSYCPWPARIIEIKETGKKAKVFFFGSNNEGVVDLKEIVEFTKATKTVRLLLLRNQEMFSNGIRSIERILGIPEELSFFKKTNELQ